MTQTTIGRRGSRMLEQAFPMQGRSASREANERSPGGVDNDLVAVKELDEEEDIKNREQPSRSRPMSIRLEPQPPGSPAQPLDLLASD